MAMVIITRQATAGLAFGALTGAYYLNLSAPLGTLSDLVGNHLVSSMASPWNASILLFTLIFGGFAGIIGAGGGLQILATRLLNRQNAPRRLEWGAFGLGLICFFDGLVNALLVGRLFRPLARSHGVPGVRLAYLIDSTSSPVACLALASTWIAYQLSMIREGLAETGMELSPYSVFLQSWPANFYCLLSLVLVAAAIHFRTSIGPMKSFSVKPEREIDTSADQEMKAGVGPVWAAAGSLALLLLSLFTGLWWNGSGQAPEGTPPLSVIGYADAATVLLLVAFIASTGAALFHAWGVPELRGRGLGDAFREGATTMLKPLTVLLAAWALGSTLKELETARSLSLLLDSRLDPRLLPAAVFVCGAAISFFTGTSWGTMGILTPLAVPVAVTMSSDPALVAWVVAAVFSGAVFGDHASPLSDTTVVSSIACGVDPWDHVRTQLPYASLAGLVSLIAGFIPLGFGMNPWICLVVSGSVLALIARQFGLRSPTSPRL